MDATLKIVSHKQLEGFCGMNTMNSMPVEFVKDGMWLVQTALGASKKLYFGHVFKYLALLHSFQHFSE